MSVWCPLRRRRKSATLGFALVAPSLMPPFALLGKMACIQLVVKRTTVLPLVAAAFLGRLEPGSSCVGGGGPVDLEPGRKLDRHGWRRRLGWRIGRVLDGIARKGFEFHAIIRPKYGIVLGNGPALGRADALAKFLPVVCRDILGLDACRIVGRRDSRGIVVLVGQGNAHGIRRLRLDLGKGGRPVREQRKVEVALDGNACLNACLNVNWGVLLDLDLALLRPFPDVVPLGIPAMTSPRRGNVAIALVPASVGASLVFASVSISVCRGRAPVAPRVAGRAVAGRAVPGRAVRWDGLGITAVAGRGRSRIARRGGKRRCTRRRG